MVRRVTKARLAEWQAQAEERVRYWQEILGLRDWEVEVAVVRDPLETGELAWTEYWFTLRKAKLYLAAALWQEGAPVTLDESIVHELLHWLLHPVTDAEEEELSGALLEQTLNTIARALVRLDQQRRAG